MEKEFLPLAGEVTGPSELKIPKARSLAEALARDLIEYARLVECRNFDGLEAVILDANIKIPQLYIHPIKKMKRITVIIDEADASHPQVLALRADFPLVPHLYLNEEEFPRSLCLYEEDYAEIKLRWTPQRFVARIREWLSLTAQGVLHQEDQPLEPLLLGGCGHVVIPHELLLTQPDKLQNTLYMHARRLEPGNYFFITEVEKPQLRQRAIAVTASIHYSQPQAHGVIRKKPRTLSELARFASAGGTDLLSELRARLRTWKEENSGGTEVLNSNLIIILILPKVRIEENQAPEAVEVSAFYCFEVIKKIGEKLGLWSEVGGQIGTLIGIKPKQRGEDIQIDMLNPLSNFNREMAANLNGYPNPVDTNISAIGIGALGAPVVTNLFRSGFAKWTLIDPDKLMPHNLARHILTDRYVGIEKTVGMSELLGSIIQEEGLIRGIPADVTAPGKHCDEVKKALENSDILLDMSASVSVARFLSLDISSPARRISLFMNPTGEDLVLLAEDKDRKSTLDQIEMQYYRSIAEDDDLSGHFNAVKGRRRYGQSCRDITSALPQDYAALHAAIGSRAIREVTSSPYASLVVWRADPCGNIKRVDIALAETVRFGRGDWQVCTDRFLLKKITRYRAAKLPNETGGVLLGFFDLERKIVYLVDTLPSPPDSKEWPTLYIRGSQGLTTQVDDMAARTDGMLEYIGEWHSHPNSFPPVPSSDDLLVFKWLTDVMEEEGLPAVMMILSQEGAGCFVGEIRREPILVLPDDGRVRSI